MRYPKARNRTSYKFLQSISHKNYIKLRKLAEKRDITIQEYVKVIIIPQYLDTLKGYNSSKYSARVKKGWETRKKKQEDLELAAKNEAADTGTGAYPVQ